MAVRGMTNIMAQGQDFTKFGIQAKRLADGPADLTNLDGMCESIPEVVRIVGSKHLSLLL
jgi:hypothetical protein